MSYQPEDLVSVKVPISRQWFLAFVVESHDQHYMVETLFPVGGQTRWRVGTTQVKKPTSFDRSPPKPSKSLQREINRFKNKIINNTKE